MSELPKEAVDALARWIWSSELFWRSRPETELAWSKLSPDEQARRLENAARLLGDLAPFIRKQERERTVKGISVAARQLEKDPAADCGTYIHDVGAAVYRFLTLEDSDV